MCLRGELTTVSVAELIQLAGDPSRPTRMTIESSEGSHHGELHFEGGFLVHAELDGARGEEVLEEILGWGDGVFTLDFGRPPESHDLCLSPQRLLLDGFEAEPGDRFETQSIDNLDSEAGLFSEDSEFQTAPLSLSHDPQLLTLRGLAEVPGVLGGVVLEGNGAVVCQSLGDLGIHALPHVTALRWLARFAPRGATYRSIQIDTPVRQDFELLLFWDSSYYFGVLAEATEVVDPVLEQVAERLAMAHA